MTTMILKQTLALFLWCYLFATCTLANNQTVLWVWVTGSSETEQIGEYGNRNVSMSSNMPGSRYYSSGWYDEGTHEFWVFGGRGLASQESKGTFLLMYRYC